MPKGNQGRRNKVLLRVLLRGNFQLHTAVFDHCGVQDDSGKTTFTLINNDAQRQRLIGIPIQSIIAKLGQDKLTQGIPPVLNNIVGKKCAFEVKLGFYNQDGRAGYTVARLVELPNEPTTSKRVADGAEGGPKKHIRIG